MKFAKPFRGVKQGEIYPTQFSVGDECPPELLKAAQSLGVLEQEKPKRRGKSE